MRPEGLRSRAIEQRQAQCFLQAEKAIEDVDQKDTGKRVGRKSKETLQSLDRTLSSTIVERRKLRKGGDDNSVDKEAQDLLQLILDLNNHGDQAADSSITDNQLKGLLNLMVNVAGFYHRWNRHNIDRNRVDNDRAELMQYSNAMRKICRVRRSSRKKQCRGGVPSPQITIPKCGYQGGILAASSDAYVGVTSYQGLQNSSGTYSPLEFRPEMLNYILASLLHSFEWKLAHGSTEVDLTDKFRIVIKLSRAKLLLEPK
ncbi:unnamed protein product [Linum tenue]|uniref:Uncharacterized protein n=1 Tax=Linum tenue TaxID=586396 RepID=A0AAV0JYU8_9ROSI|nr:unnamed protein product [Linum tenue]